MAPVQVKGADGAIRPEVEGGPEAVAVRVKDPAVAPFVEHPVCPALGTYFNIEFIVFQPDAGIAQQLAYEFARGRSVSFGRYFYGRPYLSGTDSFGVEFVSA